ncbi:MAG: hypothetical protein LC754_07880 [Acidobacteria bacterium]|nr:hypothetical protein [Acidobacteriota bacterium]
MNVKPRNLKDLLISEEQAVDEAMRKAVEQALLTHKRAGNSIASWKDGKVLMIPAEKIPVDEVRVKRHRSDRER